MTLTPAQIQAAQAQLQTLKKDIASLLAAARQDQTSQGVWIQGTTLTADQARVVTAQNTLLTNAKNDANNL